MTRRLLTIAVLILALGLHLAAPAAAAPSDRQRADWTFGRWAEALLAFIQGGRPIERAFDAAGPATDPDGAPSSGTSAGGGQPIDPDAPAADGDAGPATDPDGVR